MRVKGLTEPRQPIRKHEPVSEANAAEGKVTGTTQAAATLPLSIQVLFYIWVRRKERGEGKCYLCCKAELMSPRFVRALLPRGHHTLPT